mgnify:FL=1
MSGIVQGSGAGLGASSNRSLPSTQVTPSKPGEESGGVKKDFSTAISKADKAPQKVPLIPTEKASQSPAKMETVVEPLNSKHVRNILMNLKIPPSKENQSIVEALIQNGVAASAEAIETIQTLRKGSTKQNAIQAAVIAYSKGLPGSKPMDLIASFFASQIHLSENMTELTTALARFKQSFLQFQGSMDKGLFAGVNLVVSELEKELKKLTQKSSESSLNLGRLNRGGLIKDLKLFSEFLPGLGKQFSGKEGMTNLQTLLTGLQKSVRDVLDGLIMQSILSKSALQSIPSKDDYAFWQIPNPMAAGQSKHIDLLIKKRKSKGREEVDPKKTRVVMKLETPDLGELSVVLNVEDTKLWLLFQSENGEVKQGLLTLTKDIKEKMAAMNYDVVGIKTILKKIDLKKLLLPVLNLDQISRIVTEA